MTSAGPDGPTPDRAADTDRPRPGRHALPGDATAHQPIDPVDEPPAHQPIDPVHETPARPVDETAAQPVDHPELHGREPLEQSALPESASAEGAHPAIPVTAEGRRPEATVPPRWERPAVPVTGAGPSTPDDTDPGSRVTGEPAPSASLSPSERVIPSWTDPTVRRASELIGGPLGRHAVVGRARIFTPLRVALLMGIAVLICGWLFKSPCIQTGADGGLDQGGQRPWITGCYNDVVPLFGGRGLDDPHRNPYSYVWSERDGRSDRVYPASAVHRQDGRLVADDAGKTVVLGDHTLVGDPESGYSEVQDGTLVPISADQAGDIRYLEYPVLTGYFMWGVSALTAGYVDLAESTGLVPVPLDVAAYFTIGAILLGMLYLWVIACTAKIARRRIWDTAIMCLSPLLIVHAFTNWDLIAIGLTGGGMLAWARKRPVLAGILLGLGAAAKLYPAFLLGPLLVLCLRSGRMGAWTRAAVAGAVAWVAVNAPIYLAYPHAWAEFYTMNSTRGAEWDSWYYLYSVLSGTDPWSAPGGQTPTLLNSLSLVLFLLACAAIAWFALSARRRPRFAQLAFLVIAAFLLTNKVWSPQYSLWLVPLVALALPRWRRVLSWQFAEAVVWMLLMLSFDTDTGRNLSIHPFVGAAIVRDILLVALVVRIVREAMRPELDLIRMAGDDDPAGGVLEGAPDRFTLPSLPTLVRRIRGAGGRPAANDPHGDAESGQDDDGRQRELSRSRTGGEPAL